MTRARTGYALALGAAVLVLVGSTAAVAANIDTVDPGTSAGNGMMGSRSNTGGSTGTSSLTCAAPSDLSGAKVQVVLTDMGMSRMMGTTASLGTPMRLRASTVSMPAGAVSFVASNVGWRTHELVVLPLADGAQAGARAAGADGKITEVGSLGEASASCASGTGDGIASGSVGWTTVTLTPGRYELVCNEANHYADGMYQELDVT
jgi:uncharacterized cupredoxin-like copper-binding protein